MGLKLFFVVACLKFISSCDALLKKNCYTENYEQGKMLLNCAHTEMSAVNFTDTDTKIKDAVYMLDVSSNNISTFNSVAFSEFQSLNILILSKNELNDTNSIRFEGLKKLEVLDLSSNLLQHFTWGFLQDVPFLRILDVSNNQIKSISPSPAEKLALEKFLISKNPLTSIQNIPTSVQYLDLSQTDATPQDLLRLSAYKRLAHLRLDQMLNLNETLKRMFSELSQLEEISFKSCVNLIRFDEDTFGKSNRKLRWLDISHCALTTLPRKLESVFLNLHWLDLRGNPWSCDRRIHWLWKLHISLSVVIPDFRCFNPPSLKDLPSSSYLATKVHLHAIHSKMLAGVWLLILVGAMAVIVFMIKRRMEKFKITVDTSKYSVSRYSRLKESFENTY